MSPADYRAPSLSRFDVMDASTPMPASCKAPYRKVAIVEVDTDELLEHGLAQPLLISDRSRGCIRVVSVDDRLFVGITDACAFERARIDAIDECDELNRAWYADHPDQLEADHARSRELRAE